MNCQILMIPGTFSNYSTYCHNVSNLVTIKCSLLVFSQVYLYPYFCLMWNFWDMPLLMRNCFSVSWRESRKTIKVL